MKTLYVYSSQYHVLCLPDAVTCATEPAQRHGNNNEQVSCLLAIYSFYLRVHLKFYEEQLKSVPLLEM